MSLAGPRYLPDVINVVADRPAGWLSIQSNSQEARRPECRIDLDVIEAAAQVENVASIAVMLACRMKKGAWSMHPRAAKTRRASSINGIDDLDSFDSFEQH